MGGSRTIVHINDVCRQESTPAGNDGQDARSENSSGAEAIEMLWIENPDAERHNAGFSIDVLHSHLKYVYDEDRWRRFNPAKRPYVSSLTEVSGNGKHSGQQRAGTKSSSTNNTRPQSLSLKM